MVWTKRLKNRKKDTEETGKQNRDKKAERLTRKGKRKKTNKHR